MSWLSRLARMRWGRRAVAQEPNRPHSERRLHPRVPVELSLPAFVAGKKVPSTLVDISMGGLYLSLSKPVPLAREIVLRLTSPDGVCRTGGRVVRVNPGHGVGVQFESSNPELRHLVGDLLRMDDRARQELVGQLARPAIALGH